MRIKPIRSLALAFGPLVLAIAAVAFYATPVQGSGASDAARASQARINSCARSRVAVSVVRLEVRVTMGCGA